mgnify:CR=1 FL=1
MGFDAWDKQLKDYLAAPATQGETAAWLKGVNATKWDLPLSAKQTAYLRNLFHYTVGDPGFWCKLGFFLALGVDDDSRRFFGTPHLSLVGEQLQCIGRPPVPGSQSPGCVPAQLIDDEVALVALRDGEFA